MAEDKPPKHTLRIIAAPKIRQVYWCDLWNEAQLPEFHKTRPVLIVSFRNTLHGHCTILPITTTAQPENIWAIPLSVSLNTQESWVICHHPMTVANSRLCPPVGKIPRLSEEEFQNIVAKLKAWLPR